MIDPENAVSVALVYYLVDNGLVQATLEALAEHAACAALTLVIFQILTLPVYHVSLLL